ncbi:MAG: hypothetical protein ACOYD4_04960 [Solirubrobacterales bacterium]
MNPKKAKRASSATLPTEPYSGMNSTVPPRRSRRRRARQTGQRERAADELAAIALHILDCRRHRLADTLFPGLLDGVALQDQLPEGGLQRLRGSDRTSGAPDDPVGSSEQLGAARLQPGQLPP